MELKAPVRALSIDALRGFAILTMILSSRIPYGVLPGWMYHVQVPPPNHVFNPNNPGISWVDLVFPFFLFAMGAAFPFALSRRLELADSQTKIIRQIIWRGILLMFFAVIIMHVRPHTYDPQLGSLSLILGILTFLLMFGIYFRYPRSIKVVPKRIIIFGSLILMIIFLAMMRYPSQTMPGFSLQRFDIIILVLSNVAIVGSLIWLFTRNNILMRLFILGICLAIRLSFSVETSWIHEVGIAYPWIGKILTGIIPASILTIIVQFISLFQPYFLKYLFIVIPGTIVGDIIMQKMQIRVSHESSSTIEKWQLGIIAFLSFWLIVLCLVGMYHRQVALTAVCGIMTLFLMSRLFALFNNSLSSLGNYIQPLKELFIWASAWLVLGLIAEPFEGGIKKDPSTMSYYFLTSGLAIFMIIGFSIIIDFFRKVRWVSILIDNGQNPMLAYAGGTNLLTPLVLLTQIDYLLGSALTTPWLGALKGVLVTLLLALIVQYFTRKKIFWRT